MLLCAVSATLTLALAGLIADSILTRGDTAIATDDFPALERFRPAGGAAIRD